MSPVFTTSSKSDAGAPNGLKNLRSIRDACTIPLIAIGGITRENVVSVISAGADGAAVISAVVGKKRCYICCSRSQAADPHRQKHEKT